MTRGSLSLLPSRMLFLNSPTRLFLRLLAHVAAVFLSCFAELNARFYNFRNQKTYSSFPFIFWAASRSACLDSEKKLLILDIPPVHASECVVIYAFLSLHISWRERGWFKLNHRRLCICDSIPIALGREWWRWIFLQTCRVRRMRMDKRWTWKHEEKNNLRARRFYLLVH